VLRRFDDIECSSSRAASYFQREFIFSFAAETPSPPPPELFISFKTPFQQCRAFISPQMFRPPEESARLPAELHGLPPLADDISAQSPSPSEL